MTDAECLQSDCSSSLLLLTESYNKIFSFLPPLFPVFVAFPFSEVINMKAPISCLMIHVLL